MKRVLPQHPPNNLSLAQWSLVDEIRAGKWGTLDFPKVARQDFHLSGIELVNTLFEKTDSNYLGELLRRSEDQAVQCVLLMIDEQGDGASGSAAERKRFQEGHQRWLDIAKSLGCLAIRSNCRGEAGMDPAQALDQAVGNYRELLNYARPRSMAVVIENHGGFSDDPDWLIRLMEEVNDPLFGTYPDWRQPGGTFDNADFLKKTVPFALGMSFRLQDSEALTRQMIQTVQDAGYRGWWGIESAGREAVRRSVEILRRSLGL